MSTSLLKAPTAQSRRGTSVHKQRTPAAARQTASFPNSSPPVAQQQKRWRVCIVRRCSAFQAPVSGLTHSRVAASSVQMFGGSKSSTPAKKVKKVAKKPVKKVVKKPVKKVVKKVR